MSNQNEQKPAHRKPGILPVKHAVAPRVKVAFGKPVDGGTAPKPEPTPKPTPPGPK